MPPAVTATPALRRALSVRDLVVFGLLFIGPLATVGFFGVLDARAADAVLVVAGHHGAPTKPRRARQPGGLTAREVQVLQRVAEGKTKQEIASALFRSANTVANHVSNILAEVACAKRTEAAAFAVRHGLVRPQ